MSRSLNEALSGLERMAGRPSGEIEPLVAVSVRVTQEQRQWIKDNGALALRKAIAYAMWVEEEKQRRKSQTH